MTTPSPDRGWTSRAARAVVVVLTAVGLAAAVGYARPTDDQVRSTLSDPGAGVLQELALELAARERALDRRDKSIAEREQDLRAVERRLEERVGELSAMREELQAQLEGLEEDREARIVDLVKKVQVMRPKYAAAVLTETDTTLAVEVLQRMQASKAGKAMAAMEPEVAAGLAELMADPPWIPEMAQ